MELKQIESSRVVRLTTFNRAAGPLFLPKAISGLLARYQFQVAPGPQDLGGDSLAFKIGVFEDVAIKEFTIYRDGIVVSTSAPTNLIERFLDDLFAWATKDFQLEESNIPPHEQHYESTLVVASNVDLDKAFQKFQGIAGAISAYQERYGHPSFKFDFSVFGFSSDGKSYLGRKPVAFTFARRINVPSDSGIYHSVAPLKTDDHLAVLNKIERVLG